MKKPTPTCILPSLVCIALVAAGCGDKEGQEEPQEGKSGTATTRPAGEPGPAKQKTPYCDAKVGDMVKFKQMAGPTEMIMTWTVVKVDDENVHIRMETQMGDMKMPGQTTAFPRYAEAGEAGALEVAVETRNLGRETLTIAGRQIDCDVMEMKMEQAGKTITYKRWMCGDVLGGVVKEMSDQTGTMQVAREVIEFKSGE
jgi:hypothetical protein